MTTYTQPNRLRKALDENDIETLRTIAISLGWSFEPTLLYDEEGVEGEVWWQNHNIEFACFENELPQRVIDWLSSHATQSA
jgi:hypothetical protein